MTLAVSEGTNNRKSKKEGLPRNPGEKRVSAQHIVDGLIAAGVIMRRSGNQWRGQCPMCGGSDTASKMGVWEEDGYGHFNCNACNDHPALVQKLRDMDILPAKGQKPASGSGNDVIEYLYHDHAGTVIGGVTRKTLKTGKKKISQFHIDASGKRIWKTFPGQKPLYNLHKIAQQMARVGSDNPPEVVITEGEKCANAIMGATDLVATTTLGGAGKAHLADLTPIVGWRVLIWPDNDRPGLKHAAQLRDQLIAAGALASDITILQPVGRGGSGDDAADLDNEGIRAHLDARPVLAQDELPKAEKKKVKTDPGMIRGKEHKHIVKILSEMGIRVRFNTRTLQDEYRYKDRDWEPSDDKLASHIRDSIGEAGYKFRNPSNGAIGRWKIGKKEWYDAIDGITYTRQYDPFTEWLEALPRWDGVERATCLFKGMGWTAEGYDNLRDDGLENKIIDWAQTTVFLTAIQRAYEPGSFVKEHLILSGPQDAGKSLLYKRLAPPFNWAFTDSLRMDLNEKKLLEAVKGKVFGEFSEMLGRKKADLAHIKAFLTREDDGTSVRMAYRHDPISIQRRCAFVFTTNDTNPVPMDPSGSSRFVFIRLSEDSEIPKSEVDAKLKWLDENRDQIWAEMFYLFMVRDWRGNLPSGLKEHIEKVNRRASDVNPLMLDVFEHLGPSSQYKMGDLLGMLSTRYRNSAPNERFTHQQVSPVLRFLNWTYDDTTRYWTPPQSK